MVESTALEMRRAGNRTVGSNPTLSAILALKHHSHNEKGPPLAGRPSLLERSLEEYFE